MFAIAHSPNEALSTITALLADMPRDQYPLRVEIKRYVKKRSLDQNALYWMWLGKIAKQLNHPTYDQNYLHDALRHRAGLYVTRRIKNQAGQTEDVACLRSSTSLSRQEFSEYLLGIEQWAADLGILLPIPPEARDYRDYREAAA